jgi:hypothetical protein
LPAAASARGFDYRLASFGPIREAVFITPKRLNAVDHTLLVVQD